MSKVLWQSGVSWDGYLDADRLEANEYATSATHVTGGRGTRKSCLASARRWRRAAGRGAGYIVYSERMGHTGIAREIIASF